MLLVEHHQSWPTFDKPGLPGLPWPTAEKANIGRKLGVSLEAPTYVFKLIFVNFMVHWTGWDFAPKFHGRKTKVWRIPTPSMRTVKKKSIGTSLLYQAPFFASIVKEISSIFTKIQLNSSIMLPLICLYVLIIKFRKFQWQRKIQFLWPNPLFTKLEFDQKSSENSTVLNRRSCPNFAYKFWKFWKNCSSPLKSRGFRENYEYDGC